MKGIRMFLLLLYVLLLPNLLFCETIAMSTMVSYYPPDLVGLSGIVGFIIVQDEDARVEWNFGFAEYEFPGKISQFPEGNSQLELWSDYTFLFKQWDWLWTYISLGVKIRLEWASESHGMVIGFGGEVPLGPFFIRVGTFLNVLSQGNLAQDVGFRGGIGLRL